MKDIKYICDICKEEIEEDYNNTLYLVSVKGYFNAVNVEYHCCKNCLPKLEKFFGESIYDRTAMEEIGY